MVIRTRWNPNVWSLPGGGMNEEEDISEGLRREILEETGVLINFQKTILHSMQQNFYAKDIDVFFDSQIKIFLIESFKEESTIADTTEILEKKWLSLKDIKKRRFSSKLLACY